MNVKKIIIHLFKTYSLDVLFAVISILFTKTAVGFLGLEGFANMTILYNSSIFISLLITFGLKNTFGRQIIDDKSIKLAMPKFIIINLIILSPFLILALYWILDYSIFWIFLILISSLVIAYGNLNIAQFQFNGNVTKFLQTKLLFIVIPVVIIFTCYSFQIGSTQLRLLVYTPLIIILLLDIFTNRFRLEYRKYQVLIITNISMFIYSTSQWLISSLDVFILEMYLNSKAVGEYVIYYKVATLQTVILFPMLSLRNGYYTKVKNGGMSREMFNKFTYFMLFVLIFVFTILCVFAKEIVNFFSQEVDYNNHISLVLLIAQFFWVLSSMFTPELVWYKRNRKMMMGATTGALLNLILNLTFVPIFGIYTSAYATLICYGSMFLIWRSPAHRLTL